MYIFARLHMAHGYYGLLSITYLRGSLWSLLYLQICYYNNHLPYRKPNHTAWWLFIIIKIDRSFALKFTLFNAIISLQCVNHQVLWRLIMSLGSLRYFRIIYTKITYFRQLTIMSAGIYSGSLCMYISFMMTIRAVYAYILWWLFRQFMHICILE